MYLLRNFFVCGFLLFTLNAVAVVTQQQTDSHNQITISRVENKSLLVNINSADASQLHKVKGISKKKAQAIIGYRDKNGPFQSINDLLKVKTRGINKKWLTKVSRFLTV